MLKKRIIPLMLLNGERLVKGVKFSSYRDVGDPIKSAMVYSDQDADELILLNIGEQKGINSLLSILPELTKNLFMPLSLGGGIKTFEDAAKLISKGADKVVINSVAYNNSQIITDISNRFGVQAVVISIDVRLINSKYVLYSDNGTVVQSVSLEDHVSSCINSGAGEILIQNIDKDGMMSGFDINLANLVNNMSSVPVIISAGSGDYSHIKKAFVDVDVSAVSCGSLFNFSDSSPIRAKSYLSNYEIPYKKI